MNVLLALAALALMQLEVWTSDITGPAPVHAALGAVGALALAWRRRAPLPVAAVVTAMFVAQAFVADHEQPPQVALVLLLLAAYSAGAHAPRRPAVAALVFMLAGIAVQEIGDFLILGTVTAGAWGVGRLLRERRAYGESADVRAVQALADERARIARELHDVVAHALSAMVLQAGSERLRSGDPEARRTLGDIERTGRDALGEMRRLVGMLRRGDEGVDLAPQPSLDRIEPLLERMRAAGLHVQLSVEGDRAALPPGLDVSAYRIVQEGLTNVLKHAGASAAEVRLRYGERALEVEVVDDGTGPARGAAAGYGLAGMRERVAVYGGTLTAGAADGGGWRLQAKLPLAERS